MNTEEINKIFKVLSKELEAGRQSELFADSRDGYPKTLSWSGSTLKLQEMDDSSKEIAMLYIDKCRTILTNVRNSGWDVVTRRFAIGHAAKMANHKW